LAWHFCTEKNSKKIEKVQERALRFVYEDYNSSYDNLLKKAKVPSLQIFSIFLEFFSVQKCQAKGQKLKLLRIKVWKIVSLFNLFK
jgi:hypothetical protein